MKLISTNLNKYYHTMHRKYPNILWFGNETRREIAITFDDGPHPKDTPQVLETLSRHNIHATFFLVGKYIEHYPDLVKQIHQNGHQLGIHCFRHRPFPLENLAMLRGQLDRTRDSIANTCSVVPETIRDLRPPYGAFTPKILTHLTAWGYRVVMWNNIPPHWMQPLNWTIKQVLGQTVPGSVIVLHDGHGHGTKVMQILDSIIPTFKSQGYTFVTIRQMRDKKG